MHSIHTITPKKIIINPSRYQCDINCHLTTRKNSGTYLINRQVKKRTNFSQEKIKHQKRTNFMELDDVQSTQLQFQQKNICNLNLQAGREMYRYEKKYVETQYHPKLQLKQQNIKNKTQTQEHIQRQSKQHSKNKNTYIQLTPRTERKSIQTTIDTLKKRHSKRNNFPSIYSSQYFRSIKATKSFNEQIDIFFENNFKDKLSTKQSEKQQNMQTMERKNQNQMLDQPKEFNLEKIIEKKESEDKINISKIARGLIVLCFLLIFMQIFH